jgi:hypothetical protein
VLHNPQPCAVVSQGAATVYAAARCCHLALALAAAVVPAVLQAPHRVLSGVSSWSLPHIQPCWQGPLRLVGGRVAAAVNSGYVVCARCSLRHRLLPYQQVCWHGGAALWRVSSWAFGGMCCQLWQDRVWVGSCTGVVFSVGSLQLACSGVAWHSCRLHVPEQPCAAHGCAACAASWRPYRQAWCCRAALPISRPTRRAGRPAGTAQVAAATSLPDAAFHLSAYQVGSATHTWSCRGPYVWCLQSVRGAACGPKPFGVCAVAGSCGGPCINTCPLAKRVSTWGAAGEVRWAAGLRYSSSSCCNKLLRGERGEGAWALQGVSLMQERLLAVQPSRGLVRQQYNIHNAGAHA